MEYVIVPLPKDLWKGYLLPMGYTTDSYYDVIMGKTESGYSVRFDMTFFPAPVTHMPEEYDYPDKLYANHWKGTSASGVLMEGSLIAAIETCPETWSNRLRVTEIWVAEGYRRHGIAHCLMEEAKRRAVSGKRRAVILETQSCNTSAIAFYLHEGFRLIGFDACCYTNDDIGRKEVRLELGWFPEKT